MITDFSSVSHFKDFSSKLSKSIFAEIGKTITPEQIYDVFSDYISSDDFEHCYALVGLIAKKDWHLVIIGEAGTAIWERQDRVSVSETLAHALSFSLSEMNLAMLVPDEISVNEGIIEFRIDGKLLIRIEPVQFEPVNLDARHRVNKALKGVLQFHDSRLHAGLSTIPGYKKNESDATHHAPSGSFMISTAANFALAIRQALKSIGIEIKQHQAQSITAHVFGVKNWAIFISKEDEIGSVRSPVMVYTEDMYSNPHANVRDAKVFASEGEALWHFGQLMKTSKEDLAYSINCGIYNVYGTAFLSGEDTFANEQSERFTVGGIATVWGDSTDLEVEKKILAGDVLTELSKYFGIDEKTAHSVASLMERRGIESQHWKIIGGMVFSINYPDHVHAAYLKAELMDSKNKKTFEATTKIYKAEIAKCKSSGEYAIIGDYFREINIPLTGFTEQQVIELSGFAEIPIAKRQFNDAKPQQPHAAKMYAGDSLN